MSHRSWYCIDEAFFWILSYLFVAIGGCFKALPCHYKDCPFDSVITRLGFCVILLGPTLAENPHVYSGSILKSKNHCCTLSSALVIVVMVSGSVGDTSVDSPAVCKKVESGANQGP